MMDKNVIRKGAILSSAVTVKALLIYAGYLIGTWVDTRFQLTPYGMTAGLCLGTGLGLWWLLRVATRVAK